MLKGNHVLLRAVRRPDSSYSLKWFNDPEVIQHLMVYLPMTEMAEAKHIEELGTTRARTDVPFAIEMIEGDSTKPIRAIGLNGIANRDHNTSFGIAIGSASLVFPLGGW